MLTKAELEAYRGMQKELRELKARMRQAEIAAMESEREADREAAEARGQIYDALADECTDVLMRIEAAISALPAPRMREMVRMRYVDGRGNLEIAMRMGCDERTVKRVIREAIGIMEEE